jgi:hypothetical protein
MLAPSCSMTCSRLSASAAHAIHEVAGDLATLARKSPTHIAKSNGVDPAEDYYLTPLNRKLSQPTSSLNPGRLMPNVSRDSFERLAKSPFQLARSFCEWPDIAYRYINNRTDNVGQSAAHKIACLLAAAEPPASGPSGNTKRSS